METDQENEAVEDDEDDDDEEEADGISDLEGSDAMSEWLSQIQKIVSFEILSRDCSKIYGYIITIPCNVDTLSSRFVGRQGIGKLEIQSKPDWFPDTFHVKRFKHFFVVLLMEQIPLGSASKEIGLLNTTLFDWSGCTYLIYKNFVELVGGKEVCFRWLFRCFPIQNFHLFKLNEALWLDQSF